jgi:hypothetical protein
LEHFPQKSYLRGEWKEGGWWYYYLYGLLVKVPCGTLALFAFVVLTRSYCRKRPAPLRDELVLLTPAVLLLVVVSSQMEFNIRLRYVFPSLGIFLISLGQAGVLPWLDDLESVNHSHSVHATRIDQLLVIQKLLIAGSLAYSVTSSLSVYPHHLAYFNDFVGGPRGGHKHILGSSLDWGQDLLFIRR